MIRNELIAGRWWSWWGNPFENLHADRLRELRSHDLKESDANDYKAVLRVRRMFDLGLVPDSAMSESAEILVLALLPSEGFSDQFSDLACITFDESILKVRPQDWEELYGVHDTEKIRTLIAGLRGLSTGLESIRFAVAPIILQSARQLKLLDSVKLVLAMYFRQFQPVFMRRWRLTLPEFLLSLLAQIPAVPKDQQDEFRNWVEGQVLTAIAEWQKQFDIPQIDFGNLQEEYAELDQKDSHA